MNQYNITFLFADKTLQPLTLLADKGENILDVTMEHNVKLQHNCGGVCGCTTCHVYIKSGMENLSEMEENEEDRIDMAENLTLESRLACQCEIHGDITLLVPDQTSFVGH